MRAGLLGVAALLSVSITGVANATTLYSQAWTGTFNGFTSSNGTQIADNFSLSNTAAVQSLSWYGLDTWTSTSGQTGGSLQRLTTVNFEIRVYANTLTAPGQAHNLSNSPALTPFYQQSVTANLSPTGDASFIPANPFGTFVSLYQFTANLPTPIRLSADTTYWLSILATTPGVDFLWTLSNLGGMLFFVLVAIPRVLSGLKS